MSRKKIQVTLRALAFDVDRNYKIEKLTNTLHVNVERNGKTRRVYVGARLTNEEADTLMAAVKNYDVVVLDAKS